MEYAEVDSISYVCALPTEVIGVTAEPPGSHCLGGGQRIAVGTDRDWDGVLDVSEESLDRTRYVCNPDMAAIERTIWSKQYQIPGTIDAVAASAISTAPTPSNALTFTLLGRTSYDAAHFDEAAAEIVAFNPTTDQVYFTNAQAATIGIVTIDPAGALGPRTDLSVTNHVPAATGVNSVAIHDDVLAVAIEVVVSGVQQPGYVALYDVSTTSPNFIAALQTGVMPDMVAFSPDGRHVITANEGEPPADYSVDPEGSITVVTRPATGWASATPVNAVTLGFSDFNVGGPRAAEVPASIRHVGPPTSTRAQTYEPEYVAVAPDGNTAWVSLQEQNAIAMVALDPPRISAIRSLGAKDGSRPINAFDASDRDNGARLLNWPVYSMYQPDGMASFVAGSGTNARTYFITANEGDLRDDAWSWREDVRFSAANLDAQRFPDANYWKDATRLGRLKITTAAGDLDGDGDLDDVYAFGARSFSIWDDQGALVWDSGSQFEAITARQYGAVFNNDNATNAGDGRSDDKGPEPEAVAVGTIGNRQYAFVVLERMGGIMAYDITDPRAPRFVRYVNARDLAVTPPADAGDLGPESVVFVKPIDSPLSNGAALLILGNEISGTVSIYSITAP